MCYEIRDDPAILARLDELVVHVRTPTFVVPDHLCPRVSDLWHVAAGRRGGLQVLAEGIIERTRQHAADHVRPSSTSYTSLAERLADTAGLGTVDPFLYVDLDHP